MTDYQWSLWVDGICKGKFWSLDVAYERGKKFKRPFELKNKDSGVSYCYW